MSDPNRKAEKEQRRRDHEEKYKTAVLDHAEHGVEFLAFPKIPRLNRDITITEKIDGTNAAIHIKERNVEALAFGSTDVDDLGRVVAQSRTRLLVGGEDNFGFARWVEENAQALREVLGPGVHFGEWWGQGIQRGYKQTRKWFSLFNYNRWANDPSVGSLASIGVQVIPVLYHGPWMVVVGGPQNQDVYPPLMPTTMTLDERIEIESGGPIAVEKVEELLSRRFTAGKGVLRYAPDVALAQLAARGSVAAMVGGVTYKKDPASGDKGAEGIVVFHEAGRLLFKATIEDDDIPKLSVEQMLHQKMLREIEAEGFDQL